MNVVVISKNPVIIFDTFNTENKNQNRIIYKNWLQLNTQIPNMKHNRVYSKFPIKQEVNIWQEYTCPGSQTWMKLSNSINSSNNSPTLAVKLSLSTYKHPDLQGNIHRGNIHLYEINNSCLFCEWSCSINEPSISLITPSVLTCTGSSVLLKTAAYIKCVNGKSWNITAFHTLVYHKHISNSFSTHTINNWHENNESVKPQ